MSKLKNKEGHFMEETDILKVVETFYGELFGEKHILKERTEEVLGFFEKTVENNGKLEEDFNIEELNRQKWSDRRWCVGLRRCQEAEAGRAGDEGHAPFCSEGRGGGALAAG